MDFNSEGGIKTLGLQWHPSTDIFTFSTAFKDGAITKRAVLSNMSRIFDPLGLISPVTITAKILMQKLGGMALNGFVTTSTPNSISKSIQKTSQRTTLSKSRYFLFDEAHESCGDSHKIHPIHPEQMQEAVTLRDLLVANPWAVASSSEVRGPRLILPKIRNLHPFLDDRGLLRVGGRIERASTTYDHKHPLLLPSTHHFTDLVAREFHHKILHGGPHLLLSTMRMQFWPIHGMTVAKRIVRECVKFFRVNPRGVEQLMSNCPENRVCQFRVFTHTGIDFCGPFYLKPLTRKGASPKVYVCVYICLTPRAVHLEMVESLTTDAFIGSLKRFTARRGPQHIYCDNATNFVGASRELEDLKKLFFSEQHQNSVINAASDQGIRFHFIPPASPSFGGSWESYLRELSEALS
uniref:Uncharacterized protein n=1 Tax=Phlebotomus papatasi TaxID=29031 RepID=A0A1B0GPH1_PHLPP